MVKVGLIVFACFVVAAYGQLPAVAPVAPSRPRSPAPANILEIDDPPSGTGTPPLASAPTAPAPLAPGATPAPPTPLRLPSPPVLSPPAPDLAVEAPPTSAPPAEAPPSSPADAPPASTPADAPPEPTPTDGPPSTTPADAPPSATPADAPPEATPTDAPPTLAPVLDKNATNSSAPHALLGPSLAATAPSSIPNKAGGAMVRMTVKRIMAAGFALVLVLPLVL